VAKSLAVERAARVPPVTGVLDELRVRSAESIPDDEIRDLMRRALVEEPALAGCTMREHRGQFQIVHSPLTSVGRIDVAVTRGVVTPAGEVPSLAQKRLAGALAWWVPGTQNVINIPASVREQARLLKRAKGFASFQQLYLEAMLASLIARGFLTAGLEAAAGDAGLPREPAEGALIWIISRGRLSETKS